MTVDKDSEEEYVPELREIYDFLMRNALGVATTLTESIRHFLYFCLTLIVLCIVFAAFGYFFWMLGNFQAAISTWVMALLVVLYAFLLWTDYSRMRNRFSEVFAMKKRIEEKLKIE